jgi:hypothetical protein
VTTVVPLRTSLIEPIAIPLVPVSGIGMVTALPEDRICVTLFHEIPGTDPKAPIEHHIAARLLWPRRLLDAAYLGFPAMLTAADAAVEPVRRLMQVVAH